MTRLLRSGPAITRSMASSSSDMPIVFLLRRAARMAPSLIRLARSAPEKPGVTLVDKDDARRVALGLVEQVAHAARANADEHLHKFRTRDTEKRHTGFTRDGAAQQRLASTRRADEQHAFGNARAERGKLLRVL